ncbi:MAG: sodium:solute symporter [Saprospiraceae bacterium]|nr:sodium:solute symporter [Saprospiraceae bacterium]
MSEQLSPFTILGLIGVYFSILIIVSYLTSRKADQSDFFIAGRQSPWLLVAIGMIGASLSGVTFISIPGKVGVPGLNEAFSYMQVVFGYLLGYLVIATVLMPIYYKQGLISIYGFLDNRFGKVSYKTGAAYFLLSRVIGASFRLYLVAIVLHEFVMRSFGVPFWATVAGTILLIWIYTYRGGIKTIVWTDTLQTVCMLAAVVFAVFAIGNALDLNLSGMVQAVRESEYSQVFYFKGGWSDPNNFFKQFLSGALIAIVMTGLDQDMMQKNLSCRSLKDAQKNMLLFSVILVFANLLFLSLGALLYIYSGSVDLAMPETSDQLFPIIALRHMPAYVGLFFILGLIAAAYSSADSALTSLTTSFSIDFLNIENNGWSAEKARQVRLIVHIGFSLLLLFVILIFNSLNNKSVINQLFIAAGYTYGPLLGLFSFGILTKRFVRDKWVALICILAPILSFLLNYYSDYLFNGFKFGFLVLALNGLITFLGLLLISRSTVSYTD